jgi:hypothetical protein
MTVIKSEKSRSGSDRPRLFTLDDQGQQAQPENSPTASLRRHIAPGIALEPSQYLRQPFIRDAATQTFTDLFVSEGGVLALNPAARS